MPLADLALDRRDAAGLLGKAVHHREARDRCPCPDSLVVKNGSNTRLSTSGSMPTPVSLTLIDTNSPGSISG